MDPAQIFALALGAVVGLMMALTGAGGGTLAVPMLMFAFRLPVASAAPMSLLAVTVAAGVGAGLGLRDRIVRYRAAGLMAGCGLLTAPVGIWASRQVPNEPLSIVFGVVLGYASLRMMRAPGLARARRPDCVFDPVVGRLRWTPTCARALGGAGLAAGLMAGLLGVGGGLVLVPALCRVTDLNMRSVTATSLAAIALICSGSIGVAASVGLVQWQLAVPFTAGAVGGVLGGRRLAAATGDLGLRRVFGVVGAAVAVALIGRALRAMA
jgi:uncharacterized membrane protein YfcA